VSTDTGTPRGGARGRLVLLAAGVVLLVVAIVGAGIEWGRLLVNGRLVVVEDGLSLWQGVVVLLAAALGAVLMGVAVAAGRGRLAAASALVAGAVVTAASLAGLVWLATRPTDIADRVRRGAEAIPLEGYVVPPIESIIGPGAWLSLVAGALLLAVGLAGLVVPAWRGRRRAGRA